MKEDAKIIINKTIADVMPDRMVKDAVRRLPLSEKICVIAIGKAAWIMADAAKSILGDRIRRGLILTKYKHSKGSIDGFSIMESGHPEPDANSVEAARAMVRLLKATSAEEDILFLISGGGSAIVELPEDGISLSDIQDTTQKLLRCGASITEINLIRKKLSGIKGGKISRYFNGNHAYSIILSDVIGNQNDMIASGLTYPDQSSYEEVMAVIEKYQLQLHECVMKILNQRFCVTDVPVQNYVVGSVSELCNAAAMHAQELGYSAHIITSELTCEARKAGEMIVREYANAFEKPCAVIAGGETVVYVHGDGLGGRNQELALSAAKYLDGQKNQILFSIGSDGTDGPTDAAGGIVDGNTKEKLAALGIEIDDVLQKNDAYHALELIDGLLKTGATGTNVNDVTVLLCK